MERLSRQALADVRAAVAGYREVSLAVELATAREVLGAAGIAADLPAAVDEVPAELRELFGWAVREGVTNAVRHSGAHRVRIAVTPSSVEVTDDGRGPVPADRAAGWPGWPSAPPRPAGSSRPGRTRPAASASASPSPAPGRRARRIRGRLAVPTAPAAPAAPGGSGASGRAPARPPRPAIRRARWACRRGPGCRRSSAGEREPA